MPLVVPLPARPGLPFGPPNPAPMLFSAAVTYRTVVGDPAKNIPPPVAGPPLPPLPPLPPFPPVAPPLPPGRSPLAARAPQAPGGPAAAGPTVAGQGAIDDREPPRGEDPTASRSAPPAAIAAVAAGSAGARRALPAVSCVGGYGGGAA